MTLSTSKIFLVNSTGKSLTTLTETKYEKEDHLQEFLAQYPDLLPGDQIADPACRWLFISREMPVSDGEAVGRWSLDHLFVDQDSIPTFVECKRSSDTRGRREVVAQMLDYAANGVAYWSTSQIQEAAAKTCKAMGTDLEQALVTLLELDAGSPPSEAIEAFWKQLADNLQARRIRLIFVADEIPPELRKLVEFMNEEMTNVEVLAIEVKQYLEPDDLHKVLVPRVIGATARAQVTKQAGDRGKITAETFLSKCPDPANKFFRELFIRAEAFGAVVSWASVGCTIRLQDNGGKLHSLVYCFPPDDISFALDNNLSNDDTLKNSLRQQLLATGLLKEYGKYTLRAPITDATMYRLLDAIEQAAKTVQASYNT